MVISMRAVGKHLVPPNIGISRREFLTRAALTAGAMSLGVAGAEEVTGKDAFRIVFATDSHLMVNNALRSDEGIIACLKAIEAIYPKPDFILCGGDLTHESPDLDFPAAERLIDRFLTIWKDHTQLETFFTFGNHDLVGTRNRSVERSDPRYGKGLFRMRLGLDRNYYAFERQGWRFIILDDVLPEPDGSYIGEYAEEQLAFVRSELSGHTQIPTILCGHIPSISVLPSLNGPSKMEGASIRTPASLIVHNAAALRQLIVESGANVKMFLAGHLHHLEQIQVDGISFINAGAICGNWWKGKQLGCPEGFLIVDLRADGSFSADYRSYGWKA
jgi:3',5'-cyclic-AMP phosphodiesterase